MQTKMKYILSLSLLVSCILNSYASQLDTRVREYLAPNTYCLATEYGSYEWY